MKLMSTLTRLVIIPALVVVFVICKLKEEELKILSSLGYGVADHTSNRSGPITSRFVPSWGFANYTGPYLGNLECLFEVAMFNLGNVGSHANASELENRKRCGKLRYRPYRGYHAPDPIAAFEKLPNGTTIYVVGDSVSVQHGIDLLCLLSSISRMTRVDITRKSWKGCGDGCVHPEHGNYGLGIYLVNATFRVNDNIGLDINVVVLDERRGRTNLLNYLEIGKKGDIFVMNQGLHYLNREGGQEQLLKGFKDIELILQSAMSRGLRLVWRETSAGHFDTDDGYHIPELVNHQKENRAYCVPSSKLNSTLSREIANGLIVPYLKTLNIPILETWEASFLLPELCHVGMGKDCVHFLMPGATSFFTETLLSYILDLEG